MKQKELIIVMTFSLGEAPDIKELHAMGMSLDEYANEIADADELAKMITNGEFEYKVKIRALED